VRDVSLHGRRRAADHRRSRDHCRQSSISARRTIEREIVLRPGEPYGEAAVAQSRVNLVRLELVPAPCPDRGARSFGRGRGVTCWSRSKESRSTTVDLSAGLEAGTSCGRPVRVGLAEDRFEATPRGSIQVTRRNLCGARTRTVTLFTRVSLRTRERPAERGTAQSTRDDSKAATAFHEYRALRVVLASRGCSAPRPTSW
jgi:hypothetical protein